MEASVVELIFWRCMIPYRLIILSCILFSNVLFAADQLPQSFVVKSTEVVADKQFFQHLIDLSNDPLATFNMVYDQFNKHKSSYYQLCFKYPLQDVAQADLFAKALHIKSQQPHRFVPGIKQGQYIEPRHLGFIRRLDMDGKGFTVQDRILVDSSSPTILFIQEWSIGSDGTRQPGSFVAVNAVICENGHWYFFGDYLFAQLPHQEAVDGMLETFRDTHDNMIRFIENEDVDSVFRALR